MPAMSRSDEIGIKDEGRLIRRHPVERVGRQIERRVRVVMVAQTMVVVSTTTVEINVLSVESVLHVASMDRVAVETVTHQWRV